MIGYGNPTVNCHGIGAVKFTSCNNVTIKGINWKRCGSSNDTHHPGIGFYNSSNIEIQNCSFHNSTGQAVALSKVSGNVHIDNVKIFNIKYEYHGAALFCSEIFALMVVNNSKFAFNQATESIFYIYTSRRFPSDYTIQNSVFIHNQGIPINIVGSNLRFSGSVLFTRNMADTGGGFYCNNSDITFEKSAEVTFSYNKADKGGAINAINSTIHFDGNSMVLFNDNIALYGGAIYSEYDSLIKFYGNAMIMFNNNNVIRNGGAIYSHQSQISFAGTCNITLTHNSAKMDGGVVYSDDSYVFFTKNCNILFYHNSAEINGGAIYSFFN